MFCKNCNHPIAKCQRKGSFTKIINIVAENPRFQSWDEGVEMRININGVITMVTMKSSYKFRAYPSKGQKAILDRQMRLSKELYNLLLERAQQHFKDTGKTFTRYDMIRWVTKFKREHTEYNDVHSQVLQNVPDRVSKAYKNFFRRVKERYNGKRQKVGFPRFKKFVSSLTYPQSGFRIEKKRVSLSKIGSVNFVNHREIEGTVKTLSIKKTKSQEWYITISVEKEDMPFVSNNKPQIGLDLGLKEYATLSDSTRILNLRFQREYENKLRKAHQRISRRKKSSRNRRKAVLNLARISEHIERKREDYIHKLSHNLVNSYSFIAYEELNIIGMVKNHHLAESINDVSWGRLTQFLCYKAESAGCRVVGVNPRNTSRTCSECGNVQDIPLSERIFNCKKCGLRMDRDLNASMNILKRATEGQSGSYASGDGVRPSHMKATVNESGTIFGGAS